MDRGEQEEVERRIESKEDVSIPLDLIPDILLRLPSKSVARFRCVSKLWSSITTRPDFITSFATHQSSTSARLCLLVSDKKRDHKRLFISLPQHEHPVTSYSHVDRFQINPFDCKSPCSESVHGLICFEDSGRIVVWNPTMRQKVTLPEPKPKVKFRSCCCLGYDPVEHKYKVLCFSSPVHRYPLGYPLVFTLGPQESWRVIENSPNQFPCNIGLMGTCINGHVYYKAWLPINTETFGDYEGILMRFDVKYEKFKPIKKLDDPIIGDSFFNYEGKVAWICTNYSSLRVWVLEDHEEKQEWSLRNFVLPFSTYPQIDLVWGVELEFKGVTHDTGEFIYIAERFDEAIYVLYYDPKRSHTRRVKYQGIGEEEFRKRSYFKNNISGVIHFYPNHIESLVSLENVLRYKSQVF